MLDRVIIFLATAEQDAGRLAAATTTTAKGHNGRSWSSPRRAEGIRRLHDAGQPRETQRKVIFCSPYSEATLYILQ